MDKAVNEAQYVWDKAIALSPNAVAMLKALLIDYYPEPWESELRREILKRLDEVQ